MATQGTGRTLSELEFSWFASRAGAVDRKLSDMKRRYFGSKIGRATDSPSISVEELERRWLISVSGLSETEGVARLWAGACAAQSAPVSKFVDQNKRSFYSTVTGTP